MIRWLFDGRRITGEAPVHDLEMRKILRRTFSGNDGRDALTFILTDLGFFDEMKDSKGAPLTGEALIRATALRDYARRLLEQLGVLHEGHAREIVNQFLNLPVWEKKDNDRGNHGSE